MYQSRNSKIKKGILYAFFLSFLPVLIIIFNTSMVYGVQGINKHGAVKDTSECNMPKFKISTNKSDLCLIYQLNTFKEKNCRLDTFNISSTSTIGLLRQALKSHFNIDRRFAYLKQLKANREKNQHKVYGKSVDSILILSKEVIVVTKSIVSFQGDVTSSYHDFFQNMVRHLLKKGDNYLLNKSKKSKVKPIQLYSYRNTLRAEPSEANFYFFYSKNSGLNEIKQIQDYLNSIHFEKVKDNFEYMIIGDDNIKIDKLGLSDFHVVQHYTLNFAILYKSSNR